jgi:hypothetical protein
VALVEGPASQGIPHGVIGDGRWTNCPRMPMSDGRDTKALGIVNSPTQVSLKLKMDEKTRMVVK